MSRFMLKGTRNRKTLYCHFFYTRSLCHLFYTVTLRAFIVLKQDLRGKLKSVYIKDMSHLSKEKEA